MAWIGGILTKVNASRDELAKKLALMAEATCAASETPALNHPRCIIPILDDMHGQALAEMSLDVEEEPLEHVHTAYRQRLVLIHDGRLHSLRKTTSKFSRGQHGVDETATDSLAHLLAERPGSLEQKVKKALLGLDGDYALAVSDTDQIVISRNSLGTKPLYFGENRRLSGFASNKKPLWKIGLDEVRPLRAGMLAVFDHEGVIVRKAFPLRRRRKEIEITDMAQALNAYELALCSAVQRRITQASHAQEVGVLLSGGVDSCVMAKLVQDAGSRLGMEVIAYTAGSPDSLDVKFAQEFARDLGIRHRVKTLGIGEIEEYIPKVIEAIEDGDFVQVETGIGLYAALEMASRDSVKVIFSGQGPDELWGGYSWYPKVLGKDGRQELCRRMWDDLTRVDIETLDRENKIAMAHGVELLFPYLDADVVNVAMTTASELKVTSEKDRLGKHVHRQLAIRMGISEKYANREKLAIQHGTGIHGVLDTIARKNGFDPFLVKDIGYKSGDITTEKMGSSARYGYRYIDKKLWQVPQHVQFFLHALAYQKGLLDRAVENRVGHFVERARLSSGVLV